MDYKKIGAFINKLRQEKKLTQEEVANDLHVDRSTVSKWERGNYLPNSEVIAMLAEYYNVSINEILYGERESNTNKNELKNLSFNLLGKQIKKTKKVFVVSISIILSLAIVLLVYYFFTNYNSIRVYRIDGESENFYIQDGLMIVSKDKSYIKIGGINKMNNKEIESIKLYYFKDGNEHDFTNISNLDDLLINRNGYNEYFDYNDLDYVISDLNLEIKSEDSIDEMKLNIVRDFSNTNIFYNESLNLESYVKTDMSIYNVPKYILENYKLDLANRYYYFNKLNKNGNLESSKYYYETKLFYLKIKDKEWKYLLDNRLLYYVISIDSEYSFIVNDEAFKQNSCTNCSNDVKYFLENYLFIFS